MPDEDEQRASLVGNQSGGVKEADEVLVRPFQGDRQQQRPRAEVIAASQLLFGYPARSRRQTDPIRDDVDLLFRQFEKLHEVPTRRVRRGDDAVGTTRSEWDEGTQRERPP